MAELRKCNIIGGGLAGIAAAWWCKEQRPELEVCLLEKAAMPLSWMTRKGLRKVPLGSALAASDTVEADYARGWPHISAPLARWPGQSTVAWLLSLGLPVEANPAGQLIAGDPAALAKALTQVLHQAGVSVQTDFAVESISPQPDGRFRIWSREGSAESAQAIVLATGGERNHGMALARELGCETVPVVPAFLRLRLASGTLHARFGDMDRNVRLKCPKSGREAEGQLGLSARGIEGSAVSRLSAGLCSDWEKIRYRVSLQVDWVPELGAATVRAELDSRCQSGRKKALGMDPLFGFSSREWNAFLKAARVEADTPWIRLKTRKLQALVQVLKSHPIACAGMGLPGGERAWAGGIHSEAVDWECGQSRQHKGLYFAGEILDYLGAPGGSHLNLAWASGYVAGSAMAQSGRD